MAARPVEKDAHGQIVITRPSQSSPASSDPPHSDTYVEAKDFPDRMPQVPLEYHTFEGLTAEEQLRVRGFAHFRNCFTAEFIEELRLFIDEGEAGVAKYYSAETLDYSRPSGQGNVFQGDQLSMSFREEAKTAPGMACGSALARLVAWPRSVDALRQCGVAAPKLWAGYVLSKGAGGPPLYWHQDWLFWNHEEETKADHPYQLFGMIYLCRTRVHNGCLKVLPGSHRYRTLQHKHNGHSGWLDEGTDMFKKEELFANPSEAVDVSADIGDFIVGDSRCLHSAHPNQSDRRRTCVTLWYLNRYEQLAPGMQQLYASPWADGWSSGLSAAEAALVAPLRPAPPPSDTVPDEGFRGPVLEYHLRVISIHTEILI
jgi:phytanoyl-CoA hydroxylase